MTRLRAYASRTGTKRNLAALEAAGWGLLVSAYGVHRTEGFDDYMLDPGAWSVKPGETWDSRKWVDLLDKYGANSAQTVAPDVVSGGRASLALSLAWLPDLLALGRPVMLSAQNGLAPADLRPYVGGMVHLAVGGSTAWKWGTLTSWCELGRVAGCRVHVLRANSARMAQWAKSCGAHSFDGTGPTKFGPDSLRRIDAGRVAPAQMTMTGLGLPAPFTPRSK